jgi:hypothetical protein
MCLRDIGVKNLNKIFDSLKDENKTLFLSVCEEIFWFVFSKLEAKNESTRTSFHNTFEEITNDLSIMSEFDLFKFYFEDNFYVIENSFDSKKEFFDFMIELSLLFIHIKSCKETETKILENIMKTTQLAIDYSINHQKKQSIAIKILYHSLKFCSDSKLKELSFDRYKCIQLVMNSLNNSNDMDVNKSVVFICVKLVKNISKAEKSKLLSNSTNNKTLLKIVESNLHSDTNQDVLIYSTLVFIQLLNSDSFEEMEIKILEKLLKVTLIVMDLFPSHQKLQFKVIYLILSLLRECRDSVLQIVSFDKYKCIQLVMKSMINFELNDKDSHITNSFSNISSVFIIITILDYEKSNSSSKPIYVKTLLNIIRMSFKHKKTFNILLEYCLNHISNETNEVLLKEKVFDLYFLVLKVSLEIFAYFVFKYKFCLFFRNLLIKKISRK